MQKGLIKAGVLSIIFIIATLIFGMMTNHVNQDLTTEMKEAKLPVISLFQGEMRLNELHGYRAQMNDAYMRDTITPIGKDRKLPIEIETYQTAVDKLSYEIRSLDGKRLIADAQVDSYEEKRGIISAELEIQNLLKEGEEYLLLIQLQSGEDLLSYYTRIIKLQNSHVADCVAFVQEFHEKTFQKETAGTLNSYMERTTGDNTTLQFVSLNSSLKQVSWGDFKGERLTVPIPSVKEITDTYNVIVLDYVMTGVGENGESEYYNIEEYYRVRYTGSRIYLLNFERTMNQIFRGENVVPYENYIPLGIRPADVEYQTNEAGTSVAFVQEGELWNYSQTENSLAKVFSFRGYEGIDDRENYGEHDIKIVSIDEAGSLVYIVFGYMNRGIHEGQVGTAVYRYDSLSNTNEELVFLPSDKSYEVMKSELGQLMYVNKSGQLYLMVNESVYGIDLATLEIRELIGGLGSEVCSVSESNRFFAWTSGGASESSTVHVMNLSNEKVTDISVDSGKYVRPLGFMQEDFVYGIAESADVADGGVFPMYQVKIADVSSGKAEVLKTYQKEGYFISGVEIDADTMYLYRIQYNGTAYVDAEWDMIMNRERGDEQAVEIVSSVSPEKQTQYQIALAEPVNPKAPKLLTPKETILEEDRNVSLEQNSDRERYYVYVKGDMILATEHVTEAIRKANEMMGVVIADNQKYVWKRSRKAIQPEFADIEVGAEDEQSGSVEQCINAMLAKEGLNINVNVLTARGETPQSILKSAMKDARILDLTGCSVEEVLYYVSGGSPVFAMTEQRNAVLIVGYDAVSVTIFDPISGTKFKQGMEEANAVFSGAGNVFLTYLK